MARRKLFRQTEEKVQKEETIPIEDIAEDYISLKKQEKDIKSRTSKLNKMLKEHIESSEYSYVETDKGTVSLTYREKVDFDEEGLIEQFRGDSRIVKTKEYVDFDALESALYKGDIAVDEVAPFKHIRRTAVLNIKR